MHIEESEQYAAQLLERQDFRQAESLLLSLSEEGSIYSLMALAWIYKNGCLGDKDVSAAQYYYERAINQGNIEAFLDLGDLLAGEGRQNDALMVFQKGAERGHVGCMGQLGWMLANGLGGHARKVEGRELLKEAATRGHLLAQRRVISLESSGSTIFRKIGLFWRLLGVLLRTFFEVYRNRNSEKIW